MEIGVDSFGASSLTQLRGLFSAHSSGWRICLKRLCSPTRLVSMFLASASTTAASSWILPRGVILGAAAARTKNIRLTSAVTVLSAADPVRVFQEFATPGLDLPRSC